MTNSIAASPRAPHRVLAAAASLIALSLFCTPFIAVTSGQDRPAATTNRNVVVEGTLFEPLEGVATSGNAGLFTYALLEPGSVIENSVGAKLVLIPAGEFQMGSPALDTDAYRSERPQHCSPTAR
jgi:formylglycine-generating enzyme required for sulfatase activity